MPAAGTEPIRPNSVEYITNSASVSIRFAISIKGNGKKLSAAWPAKNRIMVVGPASTAVTNAAITARRTVFGGRG